MTWYRVRRARCLRVSGWLAAGFPNLGERTRVSAHVGVCQKATGVARTSSVHLQWQLEAGRRWSAVVLRLLIISEAARRRVEASWAVTRTREIIAELWELWETGRAVGP